MTDNNNEEEIIVKLVDDDGKEVEFELIDRFEFEENEYAALLELEGEEEVYLFEMLYDENDELIIINIEDEKLRASVGAEFEARQDEII